MSLLRNILGKTPQKRKKLVKLGLLTGSIGVFLEIANLEVLMKNENHIFAIKLLKLLCMNFGTFLTGAAISQNENKKND